MFESVRGRAVGAPARPAFGAALSVGAHALMLAVALLVAHPVAPAPTGLVPIHFPPLPGRTGTTGTRTAAPAPAQPIRRFRPQLSPTLPTAPAQTATTPSAPTDGTGAPGVPADEGLPGGCTGLDCQGTGPASENVMLLGPEMAAPQLLSGPEPTYPAAAEAQHVGGTVLARCTVTARGAVEDCTILRSVPLLDDAVVRALSQRRYTPAISDGHPVSVRMVISVRFIPEP